MICDYKLSSCRLISRRYSIVVFSICSAVAVLAIQSMVADDNLQNLPSLVVPSGLKKWRFELFENCPREQRTKVTVNQDGTMCDHGFGNRRDIIKKLPDRDASVVFNAARDLFNSIRTHNLPLSNDTDVNWVIKMEVEDHYRIQAVMSPAVAESLGLSRQMGQCIEIYHKNGSRKFSQFRNDLLPNAPPEIPPKDRLPAKLTDWMCTIPSKRDTNGVTLQIGPDGLSAWSPRKQAASIKVAISRDETDKDIQQGAVRAILNRFQLKDKDDHHSHDPDKRFRVYFSGRMEITLVCDRAMLVEMNVIDDLNKYVDGVNRRLKDSGAELRFIPPWVD